MKKLIISILALFLIVPTLTSCSSQEQVRMKLKTNELTIEYGSLIDTDVATYVDNTEDVLNEVKIDGIPANEMNKDYPAIGEYEISLTYNGETEKVKVIVKDTVAPVFHDINDQYEISLGKQLNMDDIKAEDLSEVTVTLDDTKVDYKKAGGYKATVIARDTSGNESKKEITIVVKDEEKTESSTSGNKATTSSSNKTTASTKKPSTSGSTNNTVSSSSGSSSSGSGSKPSSSGSSTSSGSSSSESSSSATGNTTKPKEPKPTPKPEPETWAMTEAEMIAYAKECVTSYKPTSGYGRVEWYDGFNKNNSGWFAPTTIKISKSALQIKDLIKITVDSTLELSTSNEQTDAVGNIDPNAIYSAKGYFEKVDDKNYKFYVFY